MRVLIVDDETIARARLRRLLAAYPDVEIVGEAADGASAVDAVAAHAPDLVFLDINMPGLDGFGVVRSVPDTLLPLIVFVTAYDEHALRAFEVAALDYLLKPFDAERLSLTIQRAQTRISPASERREMLRVLEQVVLGQQRLEASVGQGKPSTPATYPDRMLIRTGGHMRFIATRDIDFIQSAGNYVRLHVGAEEHTMRDRIGDVAERLDPAKFARIHRRTIVNISRIREIQPWFSGDAVVILTNGTQLRLSRGYRDVLQSGLQDFATRT